MFITRKWPPAVGGMELYSEELACALRSISDVDLEVIALKGEQTGRAPGLLAIFAFFFRATWFLLRNSRKYDVVHFGDFVLFPLAILDRWLCRSRVRCMTVYGLDLTFGRKKGLLPAIYRRFVKFSASQGSAVDCYIAISQFTGNLAESVGLGPVVVVPLGIRMENFEMAREEIDAKKREQFVFYLGRVVRRKGALWFAENVLPRFNGELKFVVAGRFYSSEEREYLSGLPNVEVLGQVPHVEALSYRKRAVATIMPNIRVENSADVEGFGLTALEAPAAGSILIASRLEGIEDAVMDGVTGLLAEAGDSADWEKKLREVLTWDDEKRCEFIRNARETLQMNYTWQLVAQRTVDAYRTSFDRKRLS
ncbi:MAG TPA: glycosyltransferase family 4 protein [Gammaproteobacteria bacterium]